MTAPQNEQPAEPETPEPSDSAEESKARHVPIAEHAEERKRRQAAEKSAAALQKQLDAINAANLSDLERAQQQAKDAQEIATQATAEALRYRIAAETGITDNVDLILTAGDEETMRQQAELWGKRSSTGPKPDLTQGSKGTPTTGDPAQDFARFLGAQMGHRG